jgi:hypothetical protein
MFWAYVLVHLGLSCCPSSPAGSRSGNAFAPALRLCWKKELDQPFLLLGASPRLIARAGAGQAVQWPSASELNIPDRRRRGSSRAACRCHARGSSARRRAQPERRQSREEEENSVLLHFLDAIGEIIRRWTLPYNLCLVVAQADPVVSPHWMACGDAVTLRWWVPYGSGLFWCDAVCFSISTGCTRRRLHEVEKVVSRGG